MAYASASYFPLFLVGSASAGGWGEEEEEKSEGREGTLQRLELQVERWGRGLRTQVGASGGCGLARSCKD